MDLNKHTSFKSPKISVMCAQSKIYYNDDDKDDYDDDDHHHHHYDLED